jgi:hypothetical protein
MVLEFLDFLFEMFLGVMNLIFNHMVDHMEIIVNLILDIRSHCLESLIKWSEWAAWVCWPSGSSSINNVIDLFLNAFVGNFFLGIKSDIESKLLGVNLSSIIREFTPVLNGGHVVLAHGVSSSDGVHVEESLEDFNSVIIESSEKISLVNAFIGVVLAPSNDILNWDNKSAVFNSRPDSLNDMVDSRFVLIHGDSEEITGNDFMVKSFDSIEFSHNIVTHAFLGDIILDFVLIESSNSVNVNRSLDVEHILPLFHILGSIIVAVEWLGLCWVH